jgi:hypothetical protein
MYTFDAQLTTEQKLAHITEWIAAASEAVADSAPDGAHPDSRRHADESERQRMLIDWHKLLEVERQLSDAEFDLEEADAYDTKAGWCEVIRLKLKVAGVQMRLREERRKQWPNDRRIARLEERSIALCARLFAAKEQTERTERPELAYIFGDCPCEGEGCTEDEPCPPCASRLAVLMD